MQLTPEEIAEQQKNEENTKKKYITPIIQERWGKENSDNIIMEYYFTDGRVNIDGDKVSRGKVCHASLYPTDTRLFIFNRRK